MASDRSSIGSDRRGLRLKLAPNLPLMIGCTSIIISIWMIGALNFLFLGTIGIYVATIFSETKQRPNVIVRAVYGNVPAPAARETVVLASEDNGPNLATTA